MSTVAQLLAKSSCLSGESARRDAEILLCHVLDKPRSWLYTWPEKEVEAASVIAFESLLSSRSQGNPVAYLTGRREFWTLELGVNQHTLIPRAETETLVEWALCLPLPNDAAVLDLGTGSGAVVLALASERGHWQLAAVDASTQALAVAKTNAEENNLQHVCFFESDWFSAVAGRCFDLLVSNPPYVEEGDSHLFTGDLRFEPQQALVAADGGLADLEKLVVDAPDHLHANGWLLLEHGYDQGAEVRSLLQKRGFEKVETRRDLAGLDRISGGCWCA